MRPHALVGFLPLLLLLLLVLARASTAFNLLPQGASVFAPPRANHAAHFGLSVALGGARDGPPWLLVAAPRATSGFEDRTQFQRTGALFRCPTTSATTATSAANATRAGGRCSEMALVQGVSDSGRELPIHINNGSLGAAMDALLGEDAMVICNPAFKQLDDDNLNMPGICYWITKLANNDEMQRSRIVNRIDAPADYYVDGKKWQDVGTSQLGFSVNRMEGKGQRLLIGAPGLFAGKGTVALIRYRGQSRQSFGVAVSELSDYSYFGYSVTVGKFHHDGELFVGSAPRAEDLLGKVFVFHYKNNTKDQININSIVIDKQFTGEQIGEYFGASLAVADLNGDGLDELLVGAPLHTDKMGDEGIVYIFINDEKNKSDILQIKQKIAPKQRSANARFGTAIAYLGDIDKDGFGDVAIGAPYEDMERGAIYIFYGDSESPFLKYEHRIRASDIDHGLKGFGISFSRGGDIDNNSYNDLAVGSYLSDNAVVLRSSPVIRFNSSVEINPTKIPMHADSVLLTACVMPSGLLEDTNLEVTLNIDPIFSRGYINEAKKIKYTLNLHASVIKNECQSFSLSLKNNTKVFKPLEIEISYKILQPTKKDGLFCKTCPVLDIRSKQSYHYLYYQTGCSGQVCKTDLAVNASFVGVRSPFVIGSNNISSIEMVVGVSNALESSFETNVSVTFSSAIKLRQLHQSCFSTKSNSTDLTTLLCDVPYMLNKTSKDFMFSIHFDVVSVPWELNQLQVNITVRGSGDEQDPTNDRTSLLLGLHHVANVSIKGRSSAENLPFANKHNDSEEYTFHNVSFEHSYMVVNNGPSPVQGLKLKFMIPHKYKHEGTDITYLFVHPIGPHTIGLTSKNHKEILKDELLVSQRVRDNFYLNLDCFLPEIECLEFQYNISNIIYPKQGVTVSFHMTSPLEKLGPEIDTNGLYIRTRGAIESEFILNQDLIGKTYFTAEAETKLSGKVVSQEKVQEWIIILAVICGIIILAIICFICWKFGFFKRNKPPTLEDRDKLVADKKVDNEPLCEVSDS